MSLRHILLGLLSRPCSGYDIKKEFGQGLGHFWAAELSQIYPTLSGLERDGLLVSETAPSSRGPPRKLYRRTPAGTRALLEWLAGPVVGTEKLTWLAQVFFLASADDAEACVAFMADLREAMAAELESLREIERHWSAEDPRYPDALPDEDFYPQLTLRLGLKKIAVIVEWCDECIATIRKRCRS